jgi:lipid-A-disaccharide synthase
MKTGAEPVAASAVLTSSGTMSMHCALAGIPGAIAYRAHPLTYLLGRCLVKVPYLGIANLLLNEPMYPEYLQGAATPAALAAEVKAGVHDAARQARTAEQAARLRALLGVAAGRTAAEWLVRRIT